MTGWLIETEQVPVEGLECRCPGAPHPDGDTVWLRPELTPAGALAAASAMMTYNNSDALPENLGRVYLEHGVVGWTFLQDEAGTPLPATAENIRRLKWEAVYHIADKASTLYSEAILRPLVSGLSKSSRNGRTNGLTSATSRPSSRRRKR